MDLLTILDAHAKITNALREYEQIYGPENVWGQSEMCLSELDAFGEYLLIDELWHCFYSDDNDEGAGLHPDIEQFSEIVSEYQRRINKYNFSEYSTEEVAELLLTLEPAYKRPPRWEYQITTERPPDWYLNGDISKGEFQILPEIVVEPDDPRLKRHPYLVGRWIKNE